MGLSALIASAGHEPCPSALHRLSDKYQEFQYLMTNSDQVPSWAQMLEQIQYIERKLPDLSESEQVDLLEGHFGWLNRQPPGDLLLTHAESLLHAYISLKVSVSSLRPAAAEVLSFQIRELLHFYGE